MCTHHVPAIRTQPSTTNVHTRKFLQSFGMSSSVQCDELPEKAKGTMGGWSCAAVPCVFQIAVINRTYACLCGRDILNHQHSPTFIGKSILNSTCAGVNPAMKFEQQHKCTRTVMVMGNLATRNSTLLNQWHVASSPLLPPSLRCVALSTNANVFAVRLPSVLGQSTSQTCTGSLGCSQKTTSPPTSMSCNLRFQSNCGLLQKCVNIEITTPQNHIRLGCA